MRREIKFRAKELKNCKWRYGNLHIVERGSQCHIVDFGNIYPIEEKDTTIQYGGVLNWWEVEPETVGQFTGIKDKNDIDIYEGDIIEHRRDGLSVVAYGIQNVDAFEGVGFNLWDFYGEYSDIGKAIRLQSSIEVIGNIYDNPELLK